MILIRHGISTFILAVLAGQTDGWMTDGQTDGSKDGQRYQGKDRQMDGWTDRRSEHISKHITYSSHEINKHYF